MADSEILSNESDLTRQSVELLQQMIRNRCVNDGTGETGFETRNADVLRQVIEGPGMDSVTIEPVPGRGSIVARIEGSDPNAPSLCLMGHTDVVPANAEGWREDPFGGDIIDGEIWGRGAVDMLNLTSSMAVAFRHLANNNFVPKGDLIFFGVADEEAGSAAGAQWFADHHWDMIGADYVLTESGGIHLGDAESGSVMMNVGEKGIEWRRIRVRGTPGHGSRPFRGDNALVRAAAVVQKLAEYRPSANFHELWRQQAISFGFDDETTAALLDPVRITDYLEEFPFPNVASHFYSCTHTTFSPNVVTVPHEQKTNTIPDVIDIEVDIRTLPGETKQDIEEHLRAALGDLADQVEYEVLVHHESQMSPITTPLWDSMANAVNRQFPAAELSPHIIVGFTDARVYRDMGAVAYGTGLFSPSLDAISYSDRFHGNDERIDIESMALSTQFFIDVVKDFLG